MNPNKNHQDSSEQLVKDNRHLQELLEDAEKRNRDLKIENAQLVIADTQKKEKLLSWSKQADSLFSGMESVIGKNNSGEELAKITLDTMVFLLRLKAEHDVHNK